jgi:ABC-type multidrug transport system ATPase subunit
MQKLFANPGPLSISGTDIVKRYSGKPVFKPISFEAHPKEIVAITGRNGAGKSTLLKIIAQVMSPTKGTCIWKRGNTTLDHEKARTAYGFAAPYLELYNELTALEHINLVADMKGYEMMDDEPVNQLRRFGLEEKIAESDRRIAAYSSGMKQRVRCSMAFACMPEVFLLDEITSNLDDEGTKIVLTETRSVAAAGAIVFLATNDAREREIATREIRLEPYA